jgi:hypothetical protein
MSLSQNFTVKNSINTLGRYLSSGNDLSTIFAPINVLSVLTKIDNTPIGSVTPSTGVFTSLSAQTFQFNNNSTTSSTGTGNLVFATSPSIGSPTITGHPTIEGVTSSGATGTGRFVFDNSPTLISPSLGNFTATGGTVNGNFSVNGSLFISGSANYVNQNSLVISEPIIYLNEVSFGSTNDIGFVANYNANGYAHTGLLRDHTSSATTAGPFTWYLFSNMTQEPSSNNVFGNSKTIDTLVANTSGTHTGNASTATNLLNSINFTATGDVTTDSAQSFNGSGNVALPLTIGTNKVTYSKFQQVAANTILGNSTGSTANVSEIPASSTGLTVLNASNAAAVATAAGLGTSNDVTFKTVTTSNGTQTSKTQVFTGSSTGNASLTVSTFPKTSYTTIKYIAQIKQTNSTLSGARATLEILVTNNGATSTWDGTYYGIIDTSGIFSNVDVSTTGSTVDLTFTLIGANNFTINVIAQGLTD